MKMNLLSCITSFLCLVVTCTSLKKLCQIILVVAVKDLNVKEIFKREV